MTEKQKKDEQPMTLRLPREWHDVLRERAFKERRHMSDLLRDAIKEHYSLPCDCCPKP